MSFTYKVLVTTPANPKPEVVLVKWPIYLCEAEVARIVRQVAPDATVVRIK